jgi:zinc protease
MPRPASLAFAIALALSVAAPALADAPAKVTTVEGITEYKLGNGLRVLLAPDESKPTTTVNVTYEVGSRMEKYGETGMAHLLEHLMFKGSPNYPEKTIVQEFAKRGMRFNGSTAYDRTNYFETFSASDDNLDWTLKMEADRMVNSNIWRKDLDSEMTVVRNEMESGENNPSGMLWQKMTAAAYQWHSYGKLTIGARSDVENVNIEHLQAFYRQFYQPDNAVLIVTGKFDEAKTLERIGQYFGAIAKPTRTLEPMWTVEPVQDGPRTVALERAGEAPVVAVLYHISQGSAADFAAIQLLDEILTDTPNGRLYKALVQKKLAANVGGTAMALHDPGYELILANLEKSQSPDKATKAMIEGIENIKRAPITEEELKRAKRSYANYFESIMDDPAQFGVHLSESIAVGDWRTLFLDRDRIAAATLADVQHAAETYFKESNRTSGRFIPTAAPDRAPLPPAVDVEKLVADYKGNDAVAVGEEFDPSPANIEKRTKRFTLPNGMKVAELAKKTRGDTVAGHITLRFGDLASLQGKRVTPFFAGQLLDKGAGKLSRQQIADRFEELKAKVAFSSSVDSATVNFETKREKLGDVLDLIALILRHPTFPEAEAQELKTGWLTGVENARHEPAAVASNALNRHDSPYARDDIRYLRSFDEYDEDDKAVTVADAKAFHAAFYGADHAEMGIVGDFDPAAIEPQLVKLFGDWKSKKPYARIPYPFIDKQPIAQQIETPDKANGFYTARLSVPLIEDDPAVIPLTLGNRILGGGGLKSRLVDRLRQKDGISYGSGSGFSANSFEANSSFTMNAIYAPQNLAKLKTGVSDVLETILKDGVTEDELSEAKSGLLQSWLINRSQDAALAGQLAFQLYAGRTMDYVQSREDKVKATTVEQVNDALRRYITPAKLEQFYAGDFAGAAKKEADTAGH